MATQKLLYTFSSLSTLLLLCCSQAYADAPNCTTQFFFQPCQPNCIPSDCGIITSIKYPFRLKDDPKHCGDPIFELVCENGVASVSLNSQKYYVKEINYENSTIRLADASVDNQTCSFPSYSAYAYNFTNSSTYPFKVPSRYVYDYPPLPINLINCPYPLKNSALFTQNITHCAYSLSNPSNPYAYVKVGPMKASQVPEMCGVDVIVMTSWKFRNMNNASLSEIHQSLAYGFVLQFKRFITVPLSAWERFVVYFYPLSFGTISNPHWLPIILVIVGVVCAGVCPPVPTISVLSLLLLSASFQIFIYLRNEYYQLDFTQIAIAFTLLGPRLIIFPIVLWLLIYKFRRRHLSVYNIIESFLQSDNKLTPIRYSYSDIKKMTRGFKDKIGEGGYGFVYKGKLQSGCDVAVKLLRKSGANDQDFMNEISTIGRIHHVNVVTLIGYCAQGSKCALVFDFMSNGSLEKYLFNRERMNSLNLDMKFEIAVGVARGIEYLHRGCDVQILHFDIKPHNVLLDDKFIPKISDFGLAKFCSTDKTTMTMTAARGTIGYVAPELINRNIGAVSFKADVYSFGMLLMEMVGLNKDLASNKDNSNMYFPDWIYDCFNHGKDIEIHEDDYDKDGSKMRLVRKMTIVALWCIQMFPNDRPPMNKVLEMLEGDVQRLRVPDYPSQSTQAEINVDQSGSIFSTNSVALLSSDGSSSCIDISIQD